MAEGLINHLLADSWQAMSAGTKPSGYVHPLAIKAMAELDMDISSNQSKSTESLKGESFDVVITVCGSAAENCPTWPGLGDTMHIGFPDPADATGTEEEQLAIFREIRDNIREQVLEHLRGTYQ
jgi:arsenate reductase